MIRTYYVELEANIGAYGEAWVEVEEVIVDGQVDEEATLDRARKSAMMDVQEDKIDWEHDGNPTGVKILSVDRDD